MHVAPYIYHGPLNLRIWEEKDPETQQLIAIKNYISTYEQTRTIWMDGRPHPSPFAPHTFMGFSTGHWEGDALTVTTTHLKQGWLRRNGVPESDQTTMIEHFVRHDKIPDARGHHFRSGVSGRADGPDDGLRDRDGGQRHLAVAL